MDLTLVLRKLVELLVWWLLRHRSPVDIDDPAKLVSHGNLLGNLRLSHHRGALLLVNNVWINKLMLDGHLRPLLLGLLARCHHRANMVKPWALDNLLTGFDMLLQNLLIFHLLNIR